MDEILSNLYCCFDYFDKTLVVFFCNIASFASNIGMPVGIARASFSLVISFTAGIKITRNKKRKHNKAVMLAGSELNWFKKLISQALIDNEIGRENMLLSSIKNKKCRRLKN